MTISRIISKLEEIRENLGELQERAALGFPIESETLKDIRSDLSRILGDLSRLEGNGVETCGNNGCKVEVNPDSSNYITVLSLPCRFTYCSLECQEHHTKRLSRRRYTIVNPVLIEFSND